MALVLFAGFVSRANLPVETEPAVDVPVAMVRVIHHGISPDDGIRLLVRPIEKELKKSKVKKIEKSNLVGEILAKRAKEKNINEVYFDRGENKYHGRVKAFAEILRKNGLKF